VVTFNEQQWSLSMSASTTTALTASKIRLGRSELANRRRQYVNVVA
jgi:hypothetical protein